MNSQLVPDQKRSKPWLICFKPRIFSSHTLICFPYAGGGASIYRNWPTYIRSNIEVFGVALPGRESRLGEQRVNSVDKVTCAVLEEVLQYHWNKPLILFGHSMGALLAYDFALQLKIRFGRKPDLLIVSGRLPPHIHFGGNIHKSSDCELAQEVMRLNATPKTLLSDEEMRNIILPILRDDYKILETYRITKESRLTCPIASLYGNEDTEVNPQGMAAWAELTSGEFTIKEFSGDHFYLGQLEETLLRWINEFIQKGIQV